MGDSAAEIKEWLKEHPYLEEIAGLHQTIAATVEASAALRDGADSCSAAGEQAVEELEKGIPVLRAGPTDETIIRGAALLLGEIADALAAAPLTDKILGLSRQARSAFGRNTSLPGEIISGVLEYDGIKDSNADREGIDEGFVTFMAWSALSGALQPLKQRVAGLLDEHSWRKGYCPVCGRFPAMARLARTDRGRERDLICGCCGMRWRYQRIGCPYCDNSNQEQLKIIGLDDEPELRIDTCDRCKGYLKTYTGEGREEVALADWSTLHLDLIAQEHGFKRIGYQRYGV